MDMDVEEKGEKEREREDEKEGEGRMRGRGSERSKRNSAFMHSSLYKTQFPVNVHEDTYVASSPMYVPPVQHWPS